MAMAAMLLAGVIGIALVLTLGILSSLELAVRLWEGASRADRDAAHVMRLETPRGGVASGFRPGVQRWA